MIITTSPKIWAHRNFLTVVHQANEIIEREAGAESEALAVYWGLVATDNPSDPSEFALQVTVVDAASPQTPFAFADVTDLQALGQGFRQWCEAIVIEEQARQAQPLEGGENLLPVASGTPTFQKQTKEPKP